MDRQHIDADVIASIVERSRRDQELPDRVSDPFALRQLSTLIGNRPIQRKRDAA